MWVYCAKCAMSAGPWSHPDPNGQGHGPAAYRSLPAYMALRRGGGRPAAPPGARRDFVPLSMAPGPDRYPNTIQYDWDGYISVGSATMPRAARAVAAALEAALARAHPAWHGTVRPHLGEIAAEIAATGGPGWEDALSPPPAAVFAALVFPPAHFALAVLGQDPYPGRGTAHGLAFSTEQKKTPVSLRNIFAAVRRSCPAADTGSNRLDNWAEQGVFLLNAQLTTRTGTPNEHKAWAACTAGLLALWVRARADEGQPAEVLAWGGVAAAAAAELDGATVRTYPHPAARTLSFKECPHFAAHPEIDWGTRAEHLEIYTDGSATGPVVYVDGKSRGMDMDAPTARAGGGVYVRWHAGGTTRELRVHVEVGGRQTNQRAEAYALRSALRLLARTFWLRATVYSDSTYALNQAQGLWKTNTNKALVRSCQRDFAAARARAPDPGALRLIHMRGHGRDPRVHLHPGNNEADRLADEAALR